jgi:type I restriction enzyme S subunit
VVQQGVKRGATVHSLQAGFLEGMTLRLPPLDEQRRIVDILDRAASIRRLRHQAQDTARLIIPALFNQMFGDPATNPMGWSIHEFAELGRVQLGRQRTPKYQTGAHTHPYVRVANVFEDRIDISDLLAMDFDSRDFKQYLLRNGDILLNEGQSIELVGRPAIWRDEIADCCFQNTLIRFQPDSTKMNTEFAFSLILSYYRTGVLRSISSKTSNVAHLGAGRFARLKAICPPLEEQNRFSIMYRQMQGSLEAQLKSEALTNETLAALQDRLLN